MYQGHMEKTIRNHRQVDLCLQDEINKVVHIYVGLCLDLNLVQIYIRKELVNILAKACTMTTMKP